MSRGCWRENGKSFGTWTKCCKTGLTESIDFNVSIFFLLFFFLFVFSSFCFSLRFSFVLFLSLLGAEDDLPCSALVLPFPWFNVGIGSIDTQHEPREVRFKHTHATICAPGLQYSIVSHIQCEKAGLKTAKRVGLLITVQAHQTTVAELFDLFLV